MSSGPSDASRRRPDLRRCSIPEAARLLQVSERVVRERIEAGLLLAIREEHGWTIIVEDPPAEAASLAPAPDLAAPSTAPDAATELSPLVALVERLTERNAELAAAAAAWRARAELLEAQLRRAALAAPLPAGAAAPAPAEGGIQRKLASVNPASDPGPPLLALSQADEPTEGGADEPTARGRGWRARFFRR